MHIGRMPRTCPLVFCVGFAVVLVGLAMYRDITHIAASKQVLQNLEQL